MTRTPLSVATKREVLIEAGYRCAVPSCRTILALDLHHIIEVSDDGGNDVSNLIALCGTCHDLFHRGIITRDAINSWKGMLIALNQAFDKESISNLLFLKNIPSRKLALSGDGILKFSHLISSNLADFNLVMQNGPLILYNVFLTQKGELLTNAWFSGDRQKVKEAIDGLDPVNQKS